MRPVQPTTLPFFIAAENENGDYLPTVEYSTEGERHSGIKVNAIPG